MRRQTNPCHVSLSLVGSLPRHRTMSDGEGGEGEEEAAVWRRVFEPRARAWADGRGIVALLGSLEAALPHVLGLACAKKESADGPSPTPRPWVPDGDSERAVGLAYRRASRHLHPDRTSSRDLSVRVEAEEYLKVLTAAFDDKDAWQKDDAAKAARASPGATDVNSARSNDSPGADVVGGNDLRDAVFGHQAPRPQARPPPPPPPPAAVDGGQGLRDTMFADMKGPPKPQAPPPVPQRDAPTRAWCVFEMAKTLAKNCKLHIVLSRADVDGFEKLLTYHFSDIAKIVANIDARDAQISKVEDREYIMGEVAKLGGGLGAVTATVCGALRTWLAEEGRAALGRMPAGNKGRPRLLNNLGLLLHDQGDYEGAAPLCREALQIRRETLGDRHPSTLISMNNLGGLLQAQGDYEGAAPAITSTARVTAAASARCCRSRSRIFTASWLRRWCAWPLILAASSSISSRKRLSRSVIQSASSASFSSWLCRP